MAATKGVRRSASDWPPTETEWLKFYLNSCERLTTEPFVPATTRRPNSFAQMPTSQTNRVQKLRITSAAARPCCIKVYHDPRHPSHLLLPVIPNG